MIRPIVSPMSESLRQNQNHSGVALITGASDRIGATLARTLSSAGYTVVIHYRSGGDDAGELVEDIRRKGGRAEKIKADLADRTERAALVQKARAFFGPLTILINNASVFDPDSAHDVIETEWDRHFAIHAEAPIFLSRDFAAQLPADREGNIINMIDERVLHPSPAYFSYTLSKSVLWTATRTMAQTFAPAIRVNAIGPGPVLPHSGQSEEDFAQSIQSLPLKRHADPDAIAQGVLAILGMTAYTGQMLALDGGKHLDYPSRRGPTPRK
ncbi:NAD(P)-dependent dehydrogenase, short-chain alcohol dehydrogenase family [Devosia crocina]|uniref:NAD(P)-dependent dehydrogenase, short-chain alcohol dehydrogenase family n=2 Tax=Devosia crocina TaxID=429728 RepID=A0A1I7N544_9HYPH|nr:NAD(P)-dependent dehydrogenase, short-chain alcohol dehydrogenase family [Devosia crocina]